MSELRIYEHQGRTYQYREGNQPEGAVLVKTPDSPPKNKASRVPANKGGGGASSNSGGVPRKQRTTKSSK